MPEDPQRWRALASCRGADPALFFPAVDEKRSRRPHEVDPYAGARMICASCVVAEACLEAALAAHEHHGCWGGLSPSQRERLARRRRAERTAA